MLDSNSTAAPPFGPLRSLFHRRDESDDLYIEKIRKSLRGWDRWRWVAVVMHLGMCSGVIWLGFELVELLKGLLALFPQQNPVAPQQNPMAETVVLIGLGMGASLGFMLHSSLWSLMAGISGLRNERLLIRYHDLLQARRSTEPELDAQRDALTSGPGV